MEHKLNDAEKLAALNEGKSFYERSPHMYLQERYDAIVSLSEWNFYTPAQIAQVSGMSTTTVYGLITKRGYGSGRFNPRSLDTLTQLLLNRVNGKPIDVLLKAAVEEGNSHRTIHKFTGINPSTVSRRLSGNRNTSL